MRVLSGWLVLSMIGVGCSNGRGVHPDAQFPARDASTSVDAGRDASAALDAGRDAAATHDGGRDAATPVRDAGHDVASSSGLDPQLDVPPATNEACTQPGSLSECSGIAVCRFFSATEGRCEDCSACGNLFAPCSSGDECDILFVCFRGACTNFCTLGTSECGAPADCIDIGHPTRGACRAAF